MNDKLKLAFSMFIFGSIGIFVKLIDMPSSAIAVVRGVTGALLLLGARYIFRGSIDLAAIKKQLGLLLFSGAAIGANWILLFEAYRYTTVQKATLCYYFAPVFIILLSPVILKEHITPVRLFCVAVSLCGMALVSDAFSGGGGDIRGILCGLCAALLYALLTLANKFIKDVPAADSTMVQLGTAAAVLLPYVLLTQDISIFRLNLTQSLLLLTVGFIHTGLGYLLFLSSVNRLKGQTVAIFCYIDPITAIILSAVLLREKLTPLQLAGAVLILGSTLISELYGSRKAAKTKRNNKLEKI